MGDTAAAQSGGGVVDHAIGADEAVFPGLRGNETSLEEKDNGLSNELVEILNGDLDQVALIHFDEDRITVLRVKPEGSQPVAEGRE